MQQAINEYRKDKNGYRLCEHNRITLIDTLDEKNIKMHNSQVIFNNLYVFSHDSALG